MPGKSIDPTERRGENFATTTKFARIIPVFFCFFFFLFYPERAKLSVAYARSHRRPNIRARSNITAICQKVHVPSPREPEAIMCRRERMKLCRLIKQMICRLVKLGDRPSRKIIKFALSIRLRAITGLSFFRKDSLSLLLFSSLFPSIFNRVSISF